MKEKKARRKRVWYIEEIETDMGEVDQRPVISLSPLISPFVTGNGRVLIGGNNSLILFTV